VLDLPGRGAFERFPFDSYESTVVMHVAMPDGSMLVPPATSGEAAGLTLLPLVAGVESGDSALGWQVHADASGGQEDVDIGPGENDIPLESCQAGETCPSGDSEDAQDLVPDVVFAVAAERTGASIFFVIALALCPLVLGVVILSAMLLSRRAGGRGPTPGEAAVAAVALLAILPIRQVLIPGESPGLTLFDYVLGVEVVLIAAVVLALSPLAPWATFRRAIRSEGPSSTEDEGSSRTEGRSPPRSRLGGRAPRARPPRRLRQSRSRS
jgi:hypothetical protein